MRIIIARITQVVSNPKSMNHPKGIKRWEIVSGVTIFFVIHVPAMLREPGPDWEPIPMPFGGIDVKNMLPAIGFANYVSRREVTRP